jgi:outer membrane protein
MKLFRKPFCVLFFISALSVTAQAEEQLGIPETWTAREAVSFALNGNPDSAIALHRIEQARATTAMVKANDFPLVNLRAEYGQTNNPMYSFGNILNQGAFDSSIDFNDPGRTDNLQLKAEILYRLYNGGKDKASQSSAEARLNASRTEVNRIRQILGYEVVKNYQAIIQAEKMVEVRRESLHAINTAFAVAKARFEAGDLLKQDLLNLELQQSRASENLIQSTHNLKLSKRGFLNLLGLRDGDIKLNEDRSTEQPIPQTLNFSNRYEIIRLTALEQSADAELTKAEGGRLPSVDAFASYQVDQGWELDGEGDSWIAGVRLDYNLFNGKRTSSEILRAESRVAEIAALRKKTELAIDLEIEQARLDYQQRLERLTVTKKMIGVAEEVARLSRERFKEGVILASDLIDYEMRLSDAKARNLTAEAAYQVSIANLRRAAGYEQFSDN